MQTVWSLGRVARAVWLGAVVSLATAGADQPPAAGESSLEQQVERLIAALDADSREVRTAAQRELLRIGPRVLPHLPPPELLPDSAVRATVRRLRLVLEEQQARESVRPSRVTLTGRMPLGKALQKIHEQSGNTFDSPELLQRPVQVDFRDTPFWEAFDTLAAQVRFGWSLRGASGAIRIQPFDRDEGRAAAVDATGVYRVAVVSAGLRPIAGASDERLLRMVVRLTAEPRLRPLFLRYVGSDLQASVGDRTFAAFSPDAKQEIPFGEGGKDVRVTWDFRVPADVEIMEAALNAKTTVLTAAGREKIVFTDLESSVGATRRRGGVTVSLADVAFRERADARIEAHPDREIRDGAAAVVAAAEPGERSARIRVAVGYDTGGPAFESHRTWIFHNEAWLETADGRRIEYDGFTTELQRDGAVAVEYEFDHLAAGTGDYRFVYLAPTLLIDVPIDVKLTKIPVGSTGDSD
jgi:hypothetical protein